MSYFSYFPLTSVILNEDTVDIRQARNILLRAKFSNYLKNREGLYETYQIKDGERPDTLAHKIYGRSDLHWVILLFNEILDPYYEWPLSETEFRSYINYKYPGKAVYVDDTFFYYEGNKRNQRISIDEPTITEKTPIEIVLPNGETKVFYALSYDPLLMKLVVEDPNNLLTPGTPSTRVFRFTNINGIRLLNSIRFIEPNDTSVHHFESNGEYLDPRASVNTDDLGSDTSGVTVRILLYTNPNPRIRQTPETLKAVTNLDYEYTKNETRRSINILKPYFLNEALKQFAELFTKSKTSGV